MQWYFPVNEEIYEMKTLNRVLMATLVAGFVAGLVTATIQQFTTTPLIIEAETYEGAGHTHETEGEGHKHETSGEEDAQAWAPTEGLERIFYKSEI